MTTQGKYIVGEVKSSAGMDMASAICFSVAIPHTDIAHLFSEIWGAGFFTVSNDVEAYGESVGLKVESRGAKDAALIKRTIGFNL